MKQISNVAVALILLLHFGCAHATVAPKSIPITRIQAVVESFDPESLVFYGINSLPYDSRSAVSRIRVMAPINLRGRIFTIDVSEGRRALPVEPCMLCHPGSEMIFDMPDELTHFSEKQMIPLSAIMLKPNPKLESTT